MQHRVHREDTQTLVPTRHEGTQDLIWDSYDHKTFPLQISDRSKSLIRYNFVTGVSFFQILVFVYA